MVFTDQQLQAIFVDSGGVPQDVFDRIKQTKEAKQLGIERALVSHGYVTDTEMGRLISVFLHMPFVDLVQIHIPDEVISILPEAFARAHHLIPYKQDEEGLWIASSSSLDIHERSLLEKYVRMRVLFAYATPRDIQAHMYVFQKDPQKEFNTILAGPTSQSNALMDTRIMELVDAIITHAYQSGSSDIHIEPEETYVVIRYRQDGLLHDIAELPKQIHEQMMTRLKVMARLATDEHRKAQDGKIRFKTTWDDEIEIRLSLIPTTQAEKAVLRLLSDQSHAFSLADLGLSERNFVRFSEVIHKPWGMILVTGPTGSGKTTTLYAALRVLNERDRNITSIEDPVEFDIEGVNQIQVDATSGLTFAKGLRSIVRQDPDIIMVGEIRDTETAEIAVNAAMTGHLVLSTLHTNDAATAFTRLMEMDIEEYLIASTLTIVIAQRLVRKICMACIESRGLDETEQRIFKEMPEALAAMLEISGKSNIADIRVYKGKGCHVCHQSGYVGRVGIFEVLPISDMIRAAVIQKKDADALQKLAISEGMKTMLYDGMEKVILGLTTVQEVLRVTQV